ncbi:hypothetical protein MHK_010681 [Candidatus Magnetomorum sp. HK-1]|nr:hypothetical protein MHK_010681 [Candidatus Magnetomorum sp. HK-1]
MPGNVKKYYLIILYGYENNKLSELVESVYN